MNRVEFVKVNLQTNKSNRVQDAYEAVKSMIENVNEHGYKVVSVTPLTSSDYTTSSDEGSYGESFTSGIIIVFEKI